LVDEIGFSVFGSPVANQPFEIPRVLPGFPREVKDLSNVDGKRESEAALMVRSWLEAYVRLEGK
jgi:hypothetical protein